MTTVGAFEAKTHLSQLLERVEQGEEITITRRGRAVARLVPMSGTRDPEAVRAVFRRMAERARQSGVKPITSEEWKSYVEKGRR